MPDGGLQPIEAVSPNTLQVVMFHGTAVIKSWMDNLQESVATM
jgi:hypothetical protein